MRAIISFFLSPVYTYKVLVRTLSIKGNHVEDLDVVFRQLRDTIENNFNSRLIECCVRLYILYFRSRCRWEDNIKIGKHSGLLRCFSVLVSLPTFLRIVVPSRSGISRSRKRVGTFLTLKVKVKRPFETSVTVYLSKPRNMTRDFSLPSTTQRELQISN